MACVLYNRGLVIFISNSQYVTGNCSIHYISNNSIYIRIYIYAKLNFRIENIIRYVIKISSKCQT